ncbi:hypothetical protein [Amnibacterium endophyticum]|uniref:Uncharacterized protein n=1 Tax=Amnibacterium endophyticum TaxID=2109337 RepID=A0ABW4LGV9_9MICO
MTFGHWSTLRNATNGRFLWREIALQVVAPVVIAGAALVGHVRINDASAVTNGASILSGFLFGLGLYVFQLRVQIAHDPQAPDQPRRVLLPRLIDELFVNVLWAVLVSFALTFTALAVGATQGHDKSGTVIPTSPLVTAGLVLLASHLLAVVLMCIRRTRRAYIELTR